MKKMITILTSIVLVIALTGSALAAGTFVTLPDLGQSFFPGQISSNYDGTVFGGNWGGPFYYTHDEGVYYFDDGEHGYVSTNVITGDGLTMPLTFQNAEGQDQAGYFNMADGWVLIPPTADAAPCDANLSSGYELNFDGTIGTGLQWIGCEARAYKWTMGGETLNLGSSGNSSRGTGISGDGSTIVGFDEHPDFGNRRAAIWTDDVVGPQVITPMDDASECYAASYDGSMVCGTWNYAAMYWDTSVGPINLGTLPGDVDYGANAFDISDDGKVVGMSGNPFWSVPRGFIWTPADGMMLFVDYLVQEGVDIPEGLNVYSVTSVSGDGRTFCGAYVNADFFLEAFIVHLDDVVSIDNDTDEEVIADNTPRPTKLDGAYPNPFNPMTNVKFSVDRDQNVKLSVYDMSGRLVRELADQYYAAGEHTVTWQGRDASGRAVSSGNYILYMVTDQGVQTSKMSLVR